MTARYGTVVVGAGLGGLRTVENLRRMGYDGSVALIGAEVHLPYDRPPLTKQVLRGEVDSTQFRPDLDDLDVTLATGCPATALDPVERRICLQDGQQLAYDSVVLAPGARPRLLPADAATVEVYSRPNVHVVRTIDDALALRAAALTGGSFVVIGGGFIGCEVAASLRTIGAEVDLVELAPYPLDRVLGQIGGRIIHELLTSRGVRVHAGVGVGRLQVADGLANVTLADGASLSASDVVIGLGVRPEVDWLDGSGLIIDDGVVCDSSGRASIDGVYAVGDAARWLHPTLGSHRRIEHWMSTVDQSVVVAAGIAKGDHTPLASTPYFWSDQFDVNIQALGFIDPADEVTELSVNGHTVLLYSRADVLQAGVGFSARKSVTRLRGLIARGASVAESVELLKK